MEKILNFTILKHPLNWITIITMLLLVAYVAHLFLDWHTNKTSAGSTPLTQNP